MSIINRNPPYVIYHFHKIKITHLCFLTHFQVSNFMKMLLYFYIILSSCKSLWHFLSYNLNLSFIWSNCLLHIKLFTLVILITFKPTQWSPSLLNVFIWLHSFLVCIVIMYFSSLFPIVHVNFLGEGSYLIQFCF